MKKNRQRKSCRYGVNRLEIDLGYLFRNDSTCKEILCRLRKKLCIK